MNLEQDVLKLICGLYAQIRLTRSDVNDIISTFSFFTDKYNSILLDAIESALENSVSPEILSEIKNTFQRFKKPFDFVKTPELRESALIKKNLYTPPIEIPLTDKKVFVLDGLILSRKEVKVKKIHVPLKSSLTQLLQVEGLLDETISYMNSLKKKKVLMNFIQGSLWQQLSKKIQKTGLILPLIFYSDDVEMGNGLGSHAGKNKVGANYVMIPTLPPNYASKLISIVLCDLYYASYKKLYGNKLIFEHTIKELNDLRETGIQINLKKKKIQVYFITSLVTGDNLGLNGMLGFVESFNNTVFCRICYSLPEAILNMTKEKTNLLRTVFNYERDLKSINTSESGLKEKCIFNDLTDFHAITNIYTDIMHDLYEGVCSQTMAKIILKLVEDQVLTIEFINLRLESMIFGYESSNVPLNINIEYLKSNGHMKMSASESLFFTRYFSIIAGCKIISDNEAWDVYLKLRELIHIATAPTLSNSHISQLDALITEFCTSYVELFGPLKGKFHILLHYVRVILANGPLCKISTMRFESKHKTLKTIAQTSSSKKNTLLTIAKRYQLSLMAVNHSKYESNYINRGKRKLDFTFLDIKNPNLKKYILSKVEINDCTYNSNTIILTDIDQEFPEFGKINEIYEIGDDIYFDYSVLETIGFNKRYFAYSVLEVNSVKSINYKNLVLRTPFLMFKENTENFVIGRHIF